MTISFNSKGNPVKTYDEWVNGLQRVDDGEEQTFPDGSLIGEDE